MSSTSGNFTCNSCGASLIYKPGSDSLMCTHCGTLTPIDVKQDAIIEELDFLHYLAKEETPDREAVKIIQCRQCGAESTFEEHIKSTLCPYCTTPLIEADTHEERLVKPSYLLPFNIPKEEIRKHLTKWAGKLWFIPGKLKKQLLHTEEVKGVYIPYWTYDAQTETSYQGQRCDKYVRTSGSGENKRVEEHTVWTDKHGNVSLFFDDVTILASSRIPYTIMDKIGQWDTNNLVKASPEFLSGFTTEKYTLDFPFGFEMAKGVMASSIQAKIQNQIGGCDQRILSSQTQYKNIRFKLILLPVYISSYLYKNKLYHFYMNGRKGKIMGDRPYSIWKIIFTILACIGVVGGIIAFI